MDFLRSGYKARARFIAGSNVTGFLRWYKAPVGAKVFPYPTAFGSTVWEGDHRQEWEGPGEVDRQRTWAPTKGPKHDGLHFDGSADWYLHGIPPAVAGGPLPDTYCGFPLKILPQDFGLAVAGDARLQLLAAAYTCPAPLEVGGGSTISVTPWLSVLDGLAVGGDSAMTITASYYLLDHFIDTNGTDLTVHTMDIGPGWTAWIGTWDIQSDAAVLQADGSDPSSANVAASDAGVADVNAILTMHSAPSVFDAGLVFNLVDDQNWWLFLLANVPGIPEQSFRLFSRVGGSYTQIARTVQVLPFSTDFELRVVTAGDAVECWYNNTLIFSYSTGGRPLQTGTQFGFYVHGSGSIDDGSSFKFFSVG